MALGRGPPFSSPRPAPPRGPVPDRSPHPCTNAGSGSCARTRLPERELSVRDRAGRAEHPAPCAPRGARRLPENEPAIGVSLLSSYGQVFVSFRFVSLRQSGAIYYGSENTFLSFL